MQVIDSIQEPREVQGDGVSLARVGKGGQGRKENLIVNLLPAFVLLMLG